MKWKEILFFACVYGLIISLGYSVPLFMAFLKTHCAALIRVAKAENMVLRDVARSFSL